MGAGVNAAKFGFATAVVILGSLGCSTESREDKVAKAMKAIGAAWTKAVHERRPIIVWSAVDCLSAMHFANVVSINFDIKKTNQILEPYVGFVELRGQVKRFNSEYQCYRTPAEAINAFQNDPGREWVPPDKPIAAQYKISDKNIELHSYNKWMDEALVKWLGRPDNRQAWQDVLQQPIK